MWDDVAVADRAQRDDGPPHRRAVVREVLLVDDRDDKASQERNSERGQGEEREDSSTSYGTLRARADEWLSRPRHPGSVLVGTDALVKPRPLGCGTSPGTLPPRDALAVGACSRSRCWA